MSWVILALKLAPYVIDLMLKAEEIFGKGKGSSKKSLVLQFVRAALATPLKNETDLVGLFDKQIDDVVLTLNSEGVFVKE